jgi:hypothetical protein
MIMPISNFKMVYYIVMVFSDGHVWLQVFQVMHDALITGHIGFNKTMELMFQVY